MERHGTRVVAGSSNRQFLDCSPRALDVASTTSVRPNSGKLIRPAAAIAVAVLTLGTSVAAPSAAGPAECYEILEAFDPYYLIWDSGLPVDVSTLTEVEILVDDYTSQIDDALAAEIDGLTPPDEIGSDELIDDARWEIQSTVELGRDLAGCPDF